MTSGVPGFDDRLNEVLGQQAEKAGESVETYIRRAVVTRLVAELKDDEESSVGQLLRHLDTIDLDRVRAEVDPSSHLPLADPDRLRAVADTGLMDTPRDSEYDRIVAMVSEALTVPSAAFSLIDRNRQFFKSAVGLPEALVETREAPIDQTVCQYTINSGEPLIIEDAQLDEVLKDHPAVLNKTMRAYMGFPLKDDKGHAVGTLCVWDEQPRQWTTGHQQILQDLAWIVRERIFG